MSANVTSPLFRPEVAEARKERLYGEIILAQPVRAHVLTGLLAAIVALLAAWIVLGSYTRSETARGILVTDAPSAKIVALRPGQIAELSVGEGDRVRAGQRLAVIRTEQANEQGGSTVTDSLTALDAQSALSEDQVRLAGQRAAADRARLSAMLAGFGQQRSDLARQIALQDEVVASN